MRSPWKDIDAAFEPMYDECVVVRSARLSINQSIRCCVMTDNTAEADIDDFIDSEDEQVIFCCRKRDYAYVTRLSRGDWVERPATGKTYCVQEVKEDHLLGLIIKAKTK